jgi:NADH:ubiquinone reductase (H+-translocating)
MADENSTTAAIAECSIAEIPAGVPQHRIVIVGGGFGGLNAVRALKHAPVQITLIDRRNFHLFQPLLYQVATGGLSPANIAAPLRSIVERQKNCEVLLGEVHGFDIVRRTVQFDNREIPYDTLIVAAGAEDNYFGHPEWEQHAPGLKSVEDATEIRRRLLTAFELAEREADLDHRRSALTFVIVGGGPTGVELAGTMAEISRHTLKHEFRHIDPSDAQIILIEAGERILAAYPADLSEKAQRSLERLGVLVRTKTMVAGVAEDHVMIKFGGAEERLSTSTVVWAAGVSASPLAKQLARATGVSLDRGGRVMVEPDLSIPGHPNIFVLGDMANYSHQGDRPLPGVAPVAIQQGRYVARLIRAQLAGRALPKFRYRSLGNLATIGRSAAVAEFGTVHLSGLLAWVIWLFVHLMNLVSFRNRLLVLVQWGWNYFTYDRSARLITESEASKTARDAAAPCPQPGAK